MTQPNKAAEALLREAADYCGKHAKWSNEGADLSDRITAFLATQPAPAVSAEPVATLYVEVRQCDACGHVGINDDTDLAACNRCEWRGPSPTEDHCPECGSDGTMTTACPECGTRSFLLASADLPIPAPTSLAEPSKAEAVGWRWRMNGVWHYGDKPLYKDGYTTQEPLYTHPKAEPAGVPVPGAVWEEGSVSLIRRGSEDDRVAMYGKTRGTQRLYLLSAAPAAPQGKEADRG